MLAFLALAGLGLAGWTYREDVRAYWQDASTFIGRYGEPMWVVLGLALAAWLFARKPSLPMSRGAAIGVLIGVLVVAPLWNRFVDLPWFADALLLAGVVFAVGAWWGWATQTRAGLRRLVRRSLIKTPHLSDAFQSFKEGRYGQAFALYKEAAEAGDHAAQHNLGVLYESGLGTETDDERAEHWYRQAAEAGVAQAQYQLAVILAVDPLPHVLGLGGRYRVVGETERRNRLVEGYMWALLAWCRGFRPARKAAKHIGALMGAEEISEAERKARERDPIMVTPRRSPLSASSLIQRGFHRIGIVVGGSLALPLGLFIGSRISDTSGWEWGYVSGLWAAGVFFAIGWGAVRLIGWIVAGFAPGGKA